MNEAATRSQYPLRSRIAFSWCARVHQDRIARSWARRLRRRIAALPHGDSLRAILTESLEHAASGPARETILQQRDWGFVLDRVSAPVALWHSRADRDAPFATAELVAERFPDAVLHEQGEPGHLPSAGSLHAALGFLATSPPRDASKEPLRQAG